MSYNNIKKPSRCTFSSESDIEEDKNYPYRNENIYPSQYNHV
uniref:Uncharacterized protein n=1 Tax=Lepeophtheirus salmonis TaxID=72036 RepID=A0A0K2TQ79_LEPSM